jgi:hypothetical protein
LFFVIALYTSRSFVQNLAAGSGQRPADVRSYTVRTFAVAGNRQLIGSTEPLRDALGREFSPFTSVLGRRPTRYAFSRQHFAVESNSGKSFQRIITKL